MIAHPFVYCPACAAPAPRVAPTREFNCARCGFCYFHNVASAVAALIVGAGELLVTRRARAPAAGTLDLPGGFVEPLESLEQALARELAEELGLAPLPSTPRYLFSLSNEYEFADVKYATADAFYLIACRERCATRAGDDVAAIDWLPLAHLDVAAFGLPSMRLAVARYRDLSVLSPAPLPQEERE